MNINLLSPCESTCPCRHVLTSLFAKTQSIINKSYAMQFLPFSVYFAMLLYNWSWLVVLYYLQFGLFKIVFLPDVCELATHFWGSD